jgi:hypothetical protein
MGDEGGGRCVRGQKISSLTGHTIRVGAPWSSPSVGTSVARRDGRNPTPLPRGSGHGSCRPDPVNRRLIGDHTYSWVTGIPSRHADAGGHDRRRRAAIHHPVPEVRHALRHVRRRDPDPARIAAGHVPVDVGAPVDRDAVRLGRDSDVGRIAGIDERLYWFPLILCGPRVMHVNSGMSHPLLCSTALW